MTALYAAPVITAADVAQLSREIHADNIKAGWWSNPKTGERIERNGGELLMLIVSEICEGAEGLEGNLMDDKLPKRQMIEVELADAAIRIFDFVGGLDLVTETHDAFWYYGQENAGRKALAQRFAACRNPNDYLLQIIRVVSAAMELHRKRKSGVGTEMALALHGIFILGELLELDVLAAMEDKRDFNAHREDHKIENRLKPDGKKY